MPGIDDTRPFIPVGIAVLTVSDTRTPEDDRSGDALAARVLDAGHRLVARAIVPDDKDRIYDQVHAWTMADTVLSLPVFRWNTPNCIFAFTKNNVLSECL